GQNGTLNGGAGGDLTVVAGFDFTPTTGGQVGPVATSFILDGTTSASGGSINFGKTTIITGSAVSGSSGGNVSMYAHAGASDTGNISVGSIDTSAAGNSSKGGAVVLIGQGGVSAGDITTTGFTSGSVSLLAAAPQITGGNVQVSQGVVSGPGVFGPGSAYGGNITIGGINSGGASVLIQTGGTGSIVGTTAGAAINAASLVLVSGSGGIGTAANSLYSNASTLSADTGMSVNGTGVWLVDSAAQVNLVGTNRATSFNLSAQNGNISVVGSVVANNFNVSANGNILLPSANLAVVADGTTGNGGSISLAAKSIDWVGSSVSALVLNANAASSGTTQNGGSINVILSAAGDQALGNQKGQFQLTASSGATKGNGGSLNFTNAAADLTVDVANGIAAGPQGTQGDGASIVLTAQNVLSANPSSPFVINVSGVGSGNGGTAAITILGNHDAVIGTGNNQFQLVANSGAAGGNGGKVAFSTQGALTVDSAALAFKPLGANGNGGTIQLTAAKLTPSSFVINASGVGTGNGGAIAIQLNGAGAASIGLGAGQYRLIASSGAKGGDGGSVSFVNGGNLTVDPKGITVGPLGAKGNGGNITLEAGHGNTLLAGNLLVTGALSANAKGKAVGGNITLTSNGTDTATNQVFVLGDTSKSIVNGVLGNITVSGAGGNGSLSVTNMNGGIIQRSVITAVKNVTYTDRGNFGFIEIDKPLGSAATAQITLNALGNVASNTLSGGSIT
ncbi:MAG: hypothetical protein JSS86_20315, partial [Cyanobacteria bacterium SZAS LIN-2]|nr:hypothetical protein [Cyanobacteria bacterium SZAS LIN-2]